MKSGKSWKKMLGKMLLILRKLEPKIMIIPRMLEKRSSLLAIFKMDSQTSLGLLLMKPSGTDKFILRIVSNMLTLVILAKARIPLMEGTASISSRRRKSENPGRKGIISKPNL